MTDNDIINHPSHYAEGRAHEPIDVIIDWDLGYLEGQVVKYLSRLGRKGDALEDARKAQFYMNRLVQQLETERVITKVDADVIAADSISTSSLKSSEPIVINLSAEEIDEDVLKTLFGDDYSVRV